MVNITDDSDSNNAPDQERRRMAVALRKYGIDDAAIPKIVASGYGKLAEQIVEIAFRNGVKVRQDKALAEVLTAIAETSDIPSEALMAIAEILAYVYKANQTYQSGDYKSGADVPNQDSQGDKSG
ncbi:MAG: EscU/YscU/HrcU family type III secretion system export apparatus switch protein [Micavibrio sp.]|nr:EscU/YscU/HrcU family type III secretion system export apparatus switch protein [Micavibrio sp.]